MRSRRVFLLASILALSGCAKTVQVRVTNRSKATLETSIDHLDRERGVKERLNLGMIPTAGTAERTAKYSPGEEVLVTARLPPALDVFEYRRTVTSADPESVHLDVPLEVWRTAATENPQAVFAGAFDLLGARIGLERIPVANALSTIFGGFAVVEAGEDGALAQVVYPIYASQVGSAIDPARFSFPTRGSSAKVEASGKVLAELSAKVPIAGDLTGAYSEETLYQMHWELKNYGPKWAEIPDGWTIEGALARLSPEQKRTVGNLLSDGRRQLIWVNKMVVVEAGYVEVRRGRQVSQGGKVNVMQYFSGSTVWQFDEQVESKDLVGSIVVNVGGVPIAWGRRNETSVRMLPEGKATSRTSLGGVEVQVWTDVASVRERAPVTLRSVVSR